LKLIQQLKTLRVGNTQNEIITTIQSCLCRGNPSTWKISRDY